MVMMILLVFRVSVVTLVILIFYIFTSQTVIIQRTNRNCNHEALELDFVVRPHDDCLMYRLSREESVGNVA